MTTSMLSKKFKAWLWAAHALREAKTDPNITESALKDAMEIEGKAFLACPLIKKDK